MILKKLMNNITVKDLLNAINSDGGNKITANATINVLFSDNAEFSFSYDSRNIKKYIKDYNQWDDSIIKFIDRDLVITLLEENSTNFIARISRPYSFNQRLKTGKKLDSCLELQKSVLADTKLHVIKKDLNNMILSMDDLIKLAKCDERVKAAVKSLIKSNLENEDSDSGEKI